MASSNDLYKPISNRCRQTRIPSNPVMTPVYPYCRFYVSFYEKIASECSAINLMIGYSIGILIIKQNTWPIGELTSPRYIKSQVILWISQTYLQYIM